LIRITLPTDVSVLDEEGRRDIEKMKEKAASVGLLYRVGNHFGESSLISQSGVRQETTTATTTTELYLISKEKLESIFSYMDPCERCKLRNNLLSRNGNVWYNFDSYDNPVSGSNKETIDKGHTSPTIVSSKRMTLAKTNKSFLSWIKPERFTNPVSPNSRKAFVSHCRDKNMRLRSFSAEASSDAIRRKLNHTNVATNTVTDEKGTCPLSAVDEITKMVQAGKASQWEDANDSDDSDSLNISDYNASTGRTEDTIMEQTVTQNGSSYYRATKQNTVWDPGS